MYTHGNPIGGHFMRHYVIALQVSLIVMEYDNKMLTMR